MTTNISRRSTLKKLGALGLTGAAVPFTAGAVTCESKDKVTWNQSYDIICVGSGFTGLAAAIEAKRKGANSILVIEKMPYCGGNGVINAGQGCFANTPLQHKLGIKDSAELMVSDQMKAGRGIANKALLTHIANLGPYAFKMTQECGAVYLDFCQQPGGHSAPRSHQVVERSGAGIIRPMLAECEKLGIEVRTRVKFDDLVFDDDQRVVGIKVTEGHYHDRPKLGKAAAYRATKGVVMATGGFTQNLRLRMAQDPTLTDEVVSTNAPGATGDGLVSMMKAGANPVHLAHIQSGPWASPDEGGFGYAPNYAIFNFPHSIAIDRMTGRRFMNELGDRKERADAELERRDAKGNPLPAILLTSKAHSSLNQHSLDNVLEAKIGWEFESLEAVAKHFDIPYQPLKQQVEEWNRYVKAGKDSQFGKPMDLVKDKVMQAPFSVIRLWPKVHYCMGGVQIDTKAQVLCAQTGEPIKGLYAGGEVAGGVHGVSRLGGCSIPDCLAMGITAARSIMTA
ncbi:flavocytochrome c [Ferrimonas aestuarii]|uniref:Flavocytochrome c n=1 Tax=Ferrimonas aestuarii TaxID=2569539 RepID=A0A4U1BUW8_9GAMM|nr:flavocytochrome c [Ferrimonas aestuarii]TKB58274.1 flavocytochrome c [Ferrimonas aestuarii]